MADTSLAVNCLTTVLCRPGCRCLCH
jgi:hypothetical protein